MPSCINYGLREVYISPETQIYKKPVAKWASHLVKLSDMKTGVYYKIPEEFSNVFSLQLHLDNL